MNFTNRKRKYVAEKTTATLKSKQTSIATVRYPILTVAFFPNPLLFHYPLPLRKVVCNSTALLPSLRVTLAVKWNGVGAAGLSGSFLFWEGTISGGGGIVQYMIMCGKMLRIPYSGTKKRSKLSEAEEKTFRIPFRWTKIEANLRSFVPKHFTEENLISVLFAGTRNFRFESLFPNAVDKISKSVRKDDFCGTDKSFWLLFWLFCKNYFFRMIPFSSKLSFFRGIMETVSSLFCGIFSDRNFVLNPTHYNEELYSICYEHINLCKGRITLQENATNFSILLLLRKCRCFFSEAVLHIYEFSLSRY